MAKQFSSSSRRKSLTLKAVGQLFLVRLLAGLAGGRKASDKPIRVATFANRDRGRGRNADAPSEIPAKGWKDIAWRVYEGVQHDRVLLIAILMCEKSPAQASQIKELCKTIVSSQQSEITQMKMMLEQLNR